MPRLVLAPDYEIRVVTIWISRIQLYEINCEEILKGHEIIIGGEHIGIELDAGASPRSRLWDTCHRDLDLADSNPIIFISDEDLMTWEDYYQTISREFNEIRSQNACLNLLQKSNKHTPYKCPYITQHYFEMIIKAILSDAEASPRS